MYFLAGTLIVIAIIFFMIVSRGFRLLALGLLAVAGVGLVVLLAYLRDENEARRQQMARQEQAATTAISLDDIPLSDVSLTKEGSSWTLKGTVTNNSKFDLAAIRFLVTIRDCPPNEACKTVGQESTVTRGDSYSISDRDRTVVPAGQVRLFQTYLMEFKNMPPAKSPKWEYKITEIRAASR